MRTSPAACTERSRAAARPTPAPPGRRRHRCRHNPPPARVQNPVPYRPSRAVAILRGDSDDAGPLNPDTSINRDTSKDWICESCENLNFSARRECKRCSKPRPARPRYAQTKLSKNPWSHRDVTRDWRCPACDNVNYAGRDRCNRCARPQPAQVKYVHQSTIPKDVCPTIKTRAAATESRREEPGVGRERRWLGPLLPQKRSHPSHSTRDPEKDWRCPLCNNVNFCGRVHCNKCRAIIPFDGYEAIHGSVVNELELASRHPFASMASRRCHTAVTPSTRCHRDVRRVF